MTINNKITGFARLRDLISAAAMTTFNFFQIPPYELIIPELTNMRSSDKLIVYHFPRIHNVIEDYEKYDPIYDGDKIISIDDLFSNIPELERMQRLSAIYANLFLPNIGNYRHGRDYSWLSYDNSKENIARFWSQKKCGFRNIFDTQQEAASFFDAIANKIFLYHRFYEFGLDSLRVEDTASLFRFVISNNYHQTYKLEHWTEKARIYEYSSEKIIWKK